MHASITKQDRNKINDPQKKHRLGTVSKNILLEGRYYDLIFKFTIGLKSLLRQGFSKPELYDNLVYKLKKIVGSSNVSAQIDKLISHYKKTGV